MKKLLLTGITAIALSINAQAGQYEDIYKEECQNFNDSHFF